MDNKVTNLSKILDIKKSYDNNQINEEYLMSEMTIPELDLLNKIYQVEIKEREQRIKTKVYGKIGDKYDR